MKSSQLKIFALMLVWGAVACAPVPEPESPPQAEPERKREPKNDPWHRQDPSMPEIVYASASDAPVVQLRPRQAAW